MPASRRIALHRAHLELRRRRALVGRLDLNGGVSIQQVLDEAPEDPVSVHGHGNNITIVGSLGHQRNGGGQHEEGSVLRELQDQQREIEDRIRDLTSNGASDRGGSMEHSLASSRARWSAAIPSGDRDTYLESVLGDRVRDSSLGGGREDIALAAIALDSLQHGAELALGSARDGRRFEPYEGGSRRRSGLGGLSLLAPSRADGVPITIPPPPYPVGMVLPVFMVDDTKTTLSNETQHIPNITIYSLVIADGATNGDTRTFGVPAPVGRTPVICAKLLTFWRYQMTHPCGVYQGWLSIRRTPRFSSSNGPLKLQCQADVLLLAAFVCCTAGRLCYSATVGEAAQPVHAIKSCADLIHIPTHGEQAYDWATVMAANIVRYHNLGATGEKIESVGQILDYKLHARFGLLKSRLQESGIVSARSDVVGNASDLRGVLLPMFLALDTLLPDDIWRCTCLSDKVDIARSERPSLNSNIRLYQEKKSLHH